MKKIIYLPLLLITVKSYCQESDTDILEKTISQLNEIATVFYNSTNESIESGSTYLEFDLSIFFDFRNTIATPRYYIRQKDSELIFDGQRIFNLYLKKNL